MKYFLRCVTCKQEFPPNPLVLTCDRCGPFRGTLDIHYDLDRAKSSLPHLPPTTKSSSIYEEFKEIFPFESIGSLPRLAVGGTPLFKPNKLNDYIEAPGLLIKDDSRNPSASFKDRASIAALAMAKEAKAKAIAVASTGNAASSLAALAAASEIPAFVFVPRTIPRPKLVQIMMHAAQVIMLNCDYDKAFDMCVEICQRRGWYNRNTAINPFTGEGKKSCALEIACQLQGSPEAVICPVGDGCILSGLYKGFRDLLDLGLINSVPRLYGVQAEKSAPLALAFAQNSEIKPLANSETIADSIRVGYPRDGIKALRAAKLSKGAIISVSDSQIIEAQKILARKAGIWAEPAAAAAFAGYLLLLEKGIVARNDQTVIIITGHGLKDIQTAERNVVDMVEPIEPHVEAIENYLKKITNRIV